MLKGLVAGAVNLLLALAGGAYLPPAGTLLAAGMVGFLGYGVSLALFVLALRHLGAARTGAYFSLAPFVGATLAVSCWATRCGASRRSGEGGPAGLSCRPRDDGEAMMELFEEPRAGENAPEFTVSEISGAVKRVIEGEFGRVRVRGEIGRISRPASGHLYLDLKDENAVLGAVIWRRRGADAGVPARGRDGGGGDRAADHLPGVVEVPDGDRDAGARPASAR